MHTFPSINMTSGNVTVNWYASQVFRTQSAQLGVDIVRTSCGSDLNLRSRDAKRTLVFLDGSRIVPPDVSGSVNVDTRPNALIRTVDVVTGGASAAYGGRRNCWCNQLYP